MRLRFLTYPATPMLLLAGLFVWLRTSPGNRVQLFAMLSMTAIGATELLLAVKDLVLRRTSRSRMYSHLMMGFGALAIGYSLLTGIALLFFVPGSLLLGTGLLVWQRGWEPSVE